MLPSGDINSQLQCFFANNSVQTLNKVGQFIHEALKTRMTLRKGKKSHYSNILYLLGIKYQYMYSMYVSSTYICTYVRIYVSSKVNICFYYWLYVRWKGMQLMDVFKPNNTIYVIIHTVLLVTRIFDYSWFLV